MTQPSDHEQYVQDLIVAQPMLHAFVLSLTADDQLAAEVVQETNLQLLRKEDLFTPGTNFNAWACGVAFQEVRTSRRKQQRNRLIFDDELLGELAADAQEIAAEAPQQQQALQHCLQGLADAQRDLVMRRYSGETVETIAESLDRTAGSVSQTLYRIRQSLKQCIRRRLGKVAP